MEQLKIISLALVSLIGSYGALKLLLQYKHKINIQDIPCDRSVHAIAKPRTGGTALFIAMLISMVVGTTLGWMTPEIGVLAALVAIFALGVIDDVKGLSAKVKLLFQLMAATVLVGYTDYAMVGIDKAFQITLPHEISLGISILFVVAFMNALNLLDGIDGQAGIVALTMAATFGVLFVVAGDGFGAAFSFALSAALLPFLRLNWYPSKIFMGDAGSLFLGVSLAYLAIRYLNVPVEATDIPQKLNLVVGIVALPIFDLMRVMLVRYMAGLPVMKADKNHLHHIMLKIGFSVPSSARLALYVQLAFTALASLLMNVPVLSLLVAMALVFFPAAHFALRATSKVKSNALLMQKNKAD